MSSIPPLKEQSKQLSNFLQSLKSLHDLDEKLQLLLQLDISNAFISKNHPLSLKFQTLSTLEKVAVLSIVAIDQEKNVFAVPKHLSDTSTRLKVLIDELSLFETFYQDIGGIIGYHVKVLELIFQKQEATDLTQNKKIFQAQGTSLHEETQEANKAVIDGLYALEHMAEIYPIGGAGDRLNLRDEKTGLALPTAKLNYLGQSLLSSMIKDLQAREYLYFKLFNKQLTTPIAMMTSEAKSNHKFIEQICLENQWYNRPQESFKLFKQPLAPVITVDGQWSLTDPLKLYLKPSGHGMIWKLASQEGILDWFKEQNRPKALLRQMNNPIAGTDLGILALMGIGHSQNKAFGFASCERLVNAAEGVNVLIEKKSDSRYEYAISNIEYTEFEKYHFKDAPHDPTSPYSVYPSNTNILFIDFKEVEKALIHCPIPGMLINMKTDVPFIDETGQKKMVKGGRLESTMQNIADYMTDHYDCPQEFEDKLNLKTFLTYNVRHKTISVAKKTYKGGEDINETPEGCYYTLLKNNLELFAKHCNVNVPHLPSIKEFIQEGPSAHITFHPALGPLYSIISQKIQKGTISKSSELLLQISELDMHNINLDGSLLIQSKTVMGHLDAKNLLKYSHQSGKCILDNVTVKNKGIDQEQENVFWKDHIYRKEKFELTLEENAEFYAKDVTFVGNYEITVRKNMRMIASMDQQGKVTFTQEPISKPTWHWDYQITDQNYILLSKKNF